MSFSEWMIKQAGTSSRWNITQPHKGMNPGQTLQPPWISSALNWEKKSVLRDYILHDSFRMMFWERQSYGNGGHVRGCREAVAGQWVWLKGHPQEPFGDRCSACWLAIVDSLAVMCALILQDATTWEELPKGPRDLFYFLHGHENLQVLLKKKFN